MNKASAGQVGIVLFWHAVDIIAYGIAFKFLAEWFVTPTFHTMAITWAKAFGLVLIVRMLVQRHEQPQAITLQNLFIECVVPFLFTEAGFAIHHFLGP